MFKKFFGLKENPFSVNPDPRYLYSTPHTEEALSCLTYGVQNRKGFILLTGEVGTGKTTLINKLLEWLQRETIPSAFIFNPRLTEEQFFDFMLADFGIASENSSKSKVLMRLNQWLLERYRTGETAVLVIDEAQTLSMAVLEEVRLLTNLETYTQKLLQIVLSGQPELEARLKQPELRQLRQRITLRSKTFPLTPEETIGYIDTRLRVAGSSGDSVFTPEAVESIHRYSGGIPRVINVLCEHSLIHAFADQQRPVTAATVAEVAEDFELGGGAAPVTASPPSSSVGSAGLDETLNGITALMDRPRRVR